MLPACSSRTCGPLVQDEHAARLLKMALLLSQHQANQQHIPLKTTQTEAENCDGIGRKLMFVGAPAAFHRIFFRRYVIFFLKAVDRTEG
jgi:hypothetical protein